MPWSGLLFFAENLQMPVTKHSLFVKRNKKTRAKRITVTVLPSNAIEQHANNLSLAANAAAAAANRDSLEHARKRAEKESEVERLRNAKTVFSKQPSTEEDKCNLKPPSRQAARESVAQFMPSAIPAEEIPTFASFAKEVEGYDLPDIGVARNLVEEGFKRDMVLCAPFADGQLLKWSDLPQTYSDAVKKSEMWNSMNCWEKNIIPLIDRRKEGYFDKVSDSGGYNRVLAATDTCPLEDSCRWPPQLTRGGPLPCCEASVVFRVTRSEPLPTGKGVEAIRSLKDEELVLEATYTLYAAALGFGPRVFAVVRWPLERVDGEQRYGLLMVLERGVCDFNHFVHAATKKLNQQQLRKKIESSSIDLCRLCFEAAWMGGIAFDMKPANLLFKSHEWKMIDFDSNYYTVPDADCAGLRSRFFTNLLILAVQTRAYLQPQVAKSFSAVAQHLLIPLWESALKRPSEFGAGADWLCETRIAFCSDEGSFHSKVLEDAFKKGGWKLKLQKTLSMIVYEYLFATEEREHPWARKWKWNARQDFATGKRPRLVPQLLEFALFLDDTPHWAKPLLQTQI